MREIRDDLEQEINETRWIDYRLVWDEDAQKHFLAEWHDHYRISLGLKPDKQRIYCLSLVFKWVNHIPGDDVGRKRAATNCYRWLVGNSCACCS